MDFRRSWLEIGREFSSVCRASPRMTRKCDATYILVSFEAAPPVTFCVRRAPSSVLRSPSCFLRSSLPLPQSEPALTLVVDC